MMCRFHAIFFPLVSPTEPTREFATRGAAVPHLLLSRAVPFWSCAICSALCSFCLDCRPLDINGRTDGHALARTRTPYFIPGFYLGSRASFKSTALFDLKEPREMISERRGIRWMRVTSHEGVGFLRLDLKRSPTLPDSSTAVAAWSLNLRVVPPLVIRAMHRE